MTVPAEKKVVEVPAYLESFCCDIRDQRFALIGTDMVLAMSLSRGYYKNDFVGDGCLYTANCGLYITIEPADALKRKAEYQPAPRVRFSNWMMSNESPKTVHVSGSREGLRVMLPAGEISGIDFKERDRLLAFLNELRGIEIKYVANIFGFLAKDGSDNEVVTELPFPIETCSQY